MSGDALRPEPGPLPDVPYMREPWEEPWINQGGENPHSRKQRIRGLDVLHRIKEGLPLSPREEAIAQDAHDNPGYQEWSQSGKFSEESLVKMLADNIGTPLVNPEGQIGTLGEIMKLSDERPPEQGATG